MCLYKYNWDMYSESWAFILSDTGRNTLIVVAYRNVLNCNAVY